MRYDSGDLGEQVIKDLEGQSKEVEFFFLNKFIYLFILFLAMLGPRCCARAFF